MRGFLFLCLSGIAGLVCLAGCAAPPELTWESLDRFNFNVAEAEPNLHVPAKHLYEWIYFSRVAAAGGTVTDSMITAFRDSVLVDTLISLTNDEFDLSQYWYQYFDYRARADAALRQAFWEKQVNDNVVVDSQKVSEFYRNNLPMFSLPEQVDIYHILSSPIGFLQGKDSALAARYSTDGLMVLAEVYARRLYQLLLYGESFENVAFNYSHDVHSRRASGHMGWTKRGTYVDPFDSVAFSLKDGEFSRPYQDGDGWHILYRARYNPGGPQPLDTPWVYAQVEQAVFDSEASRSGVQLLDSLRNAANLQISDLLLSDTVVHLVDDTVWGAVVNESDTVYFYTFKGMEEEYRRRFAVTNTTPDMRRIMVTHAAGPILVVQAARALGLDTLRSQVEARQKAWRDVTKALRVAQLYTPGDFVPSDSEISRYYQQHHAVFNPDDSIRAQQLIVQDEELAYFLLEQLSAGFAMDYLADYYGKQEGYDVKFEEMGIVNRSDVDPRLYDALLKTHAYFTTDVVKTDRGFHIAKVLDRRYQHPLEMVRTDIVGRLTEEYLRQKYTAFQDQMFREHRVTFPGSLPPFDLPRLSDRNHPSTLPAAINVRGY